MRLAALLLRLPLAIVGEITDLLLGPDELKGLTWPSTTPDDLQVKDRSDERPGFETEVIRAGTGWG